MTDGNLEENHKEPQPAIQIQSTEGQSAILEEIAGKGAVDKFSESTMDISNPIGESIYSLEKTLSVRMESLLEAFESKLKFDKFREEQIGRLHEELQSYKADLLARAMQPFIMGMIMIFDDIGKVIDMAGRSEDTANKINYLNFIEGFRSDIETLLAENGINSYRDDTEVFNPKRQRILKRVSTSDPSLIGRINKSLRPGFERNGNIITKEEVAGYVESEV